MVMFAVVIGVGTWSYGQHLENEARRTATEMLTSVADLKSRQIEAWVRERRGDTELSCGSMAAQLLAQDPGNAIALVASSKAVTVFRQAYDYDTVAIFSSNGTPCLVEPDGGLNEYDYAEDVKLGLKSRGMVFADLHREGPDGAIRLSFLGAITGPDTNKESVGTILMIVDPEHFLYPLIKTWPTASKTAETMLLRRENDDAVYLNDLRFRTNTALTLRVPINSNTNRPAVRALMGREGVGEGVSYLGRTVLSATRRIRETPWFIACQIDLEEVLGPVRHEERTVGLAAVALILAGGMGAAALWRQQKLNLIVRELAERKRSDEALKASEHRFRTLIECAPIAMSIEREGRILYVNDHFRQMFGFQNNTDLRGRIVVDDLAPEFREILEERSRKRMRGEPVPSDYEAVGQRQDGSQFPIRIAAGLVQLPEGPAVLGVIADITERKQALDALQRTNRDLELAMDELKRTQAHVVQQERLSAIGQLSSGVAHEINNPIMGIANYAELILDKMPADAEISTYATEIKRESQRVTVIVRNLLTFARQDKPVRAPARMCDIVDATLSLVRTIMRHDQISLIVDVPMDLPVVNCLSQQIQQVLTNLLTNARDALNARYPSYDENKRITVSARVIEKNGRHWLRTTVEDCGCGVPESVRARIFEPFFTTKPREKGTGLGLSISHGIVNEHGGEMSLETEPDHYSRFHFDLPVDG